MAYGSINADSIVTSVSGGVLGGGNASAMKNRIINGAMVIDQRNAGASVTQTTSGLYTLDRWKTYGAVASKFTVQQNAGSVTPPVGFSNYLGVTSSSAYSVGSTDEFDLYQPIEGFNTADLNWGTANAKTVTLSAWIYSSLTGTFGGAIRNSATNYSYPFTFSIASANTWTQISVTIAGPTSGTWIGATNGIGMLVNFSMGAGSTLSGTAGSWSANNYTSATGAVSVVGTNGATFYITGVQLEVGSSATGYEYVNYQTSLANCMRYFQLFSRNEECIYGGSTGVSGGGAPIILQQVMRSSPTITFATAGQLTGTISFLAATGAYPTTTGTHNAVSITPYGARMTASGYTNAWSGAGIVTALYANGVTTVYTASAEL